MTREEALIDEIRRAFRGVTLGDGISLHMTEYLDSYQTDVVSLERAAGDERQDWTRLDRATLEGFTVTFSFTDLAGHRFYLPAYMISAIEHFRHSDAIIDDFTIYAIDPHRGVFQEAGGFEACFTEAQIEAMRHFLEFCLEHEDRMDADVALENLVKFGGA